MQMEKLLELSGFQRNLVLSLAKSTRDWVGIVFILFQSTKLTSVVITLDMMSFDRNNSKK